MNANKPSGLGELQLSRRGALVGLDGRSLRRAHDRGESTRLVRGVYVPSPTWDTAGDDERYLMRIQAVVMTRQLRPVLTHQSAARVWGIANLGAWPQAVHLLAAVRGTRASTKTVVWHHDAVTDEEIVEVDGYLVTSRLRTMVDLARSQTFGSAVVTLDAGLRAPFVLPNGRKDREITQEELLDAIRRLGTVRGCRQATVAARFADGRSGSAGESVSRVGVYLAGMPAPDLQVAYRSADGHEDITDFTWEPRHCRQNQPLLGEFDGKVKYTRDQYLRGRKIEDVVWEEKVREDRLRAPGRGMSRWLWDVALSPRLLRARLLEAGLRPER